MKKRLGELLLERRLIDVDQLNAALSHQRQWGIRLGTALVAKGFIAEGTLVRVLSESLGIPMVDLARVDVDPKALGVVPARVCEQYEVFPIALKEQKGQRRVLLLAMADPLNVTAVDEIAFLSESQVRPAIAQISSIDHAIQRYYHGQKREIAPLTFDNTAAPVVTHAAPVAGTPVAAAPSTSATVPPTAAGGGASAFMDYSDEGEPVLVMGVSVVDKATLPPGDPLGDQPTGTFAIVKSNEGPAETAALVLEQVARPADQEAIEALERKFWALMRVLTRRGLVTKDEFLVELGEVENLKKG